MDKIKEIDYQLLYELDKNCRITASEAGSRLGTYQATISKKIARLERIGIIKGYGAIFNTARLGLTTYNFFLQFKGTKEENFTVFRDKFEKFLHDSPMVIFAVRILGGYNVMFSVRARSVAEREKFVHELETTFVDRIHHMTACPRLVSNYLPRKYLLKEVPDEVPIATSNSLYEGVEKIDDIDWKIMEELKKNSREDLSKIAHRIGSTRRVVSDRIRKLEEKRIIKRYRPKIRTHYLGYTWFQVLYKVQQKTDQMMDDLMQLVTRHPNIVFLAEVRGEWDFMIDIHCKTPHDLDKIVSKIRGVLGNYLLNGQTNIVLDTIKA